MSPRTWILRLAPLLLLAFLAPLAPADEGDTAAAKAAAKAAAEVQARAYERERLVRTARRAVGKGGSALDPFEAMQRSLAKDHAYMMEYEPKDAEEAALLVEFEKTVQERVLLVGWPGEEGGTPAKDGALQEARRLDAWLAGLAPCDVVVSSEGADPAKGRPYAWPPEPEKPEQAPATAPAEEEAVEAPPPGPPPPAEGEASTPEGEPAEAPPEPAPPKPAKAPEPPPKLDDWAQDVVAKYESGTLLGKVVSTQVCGVVDQLLAASGRTPAYIHPDVRRLRRHAVVSEDVFSYNAPFAALRIVQAEQREQFMQHDQPAASLVDEAMVRAKAAQRASYQKGLKERQDQHAEVVRSLDRMAVDLDAWKTQAALLAQEIEERQRARAPVKEENPEGVEGDAEEAEPPPPTPEPLALRLAEARESLVSLDITLLYMTAVRADERLKLLTRLMSASEAEAESAAQAHTRYDAALLKLRGARRLDRLYGDEHRLRLWISQLEEAEPKEGTVHAKRLGAYRAMLDLLGVVEDAVVRKRQLAPGGADEEPDEESDEAASDPPATAASEEPKPASGQPKSPLPTILQTPEAATWDVKYVELATRALVAPKMSKAFDASLIARHYAAVDDRIRALVQARDRATEEATLRQRYDTIRAAAEAALAELPPTDFAVRTRKLPNLLRVADEDFEAAMTGIAEQGDRNRERLDALLDFRTLLSSQGMRSLLIRVDRDLEDDDIRRALGDTSHAVGRATRWLMLKEDDHVGGFLGTAWWRLLLLLALAVAAVLGVRILRRRIDAWIDGRAAANPALRHVGVSVREESDEAKKRRSEEGTAQGVSAADILQSEVKDEEEDGEESDAERAVREAHDPKSTEKREEVEGERPSAGTPGGAQ